MSAAKLLCHLEGVNPSVLSKEETFLLEAELFTRICEELKKIFMIQYKNYFRIMKFNVEMENAMMEAYYVRCVINDILSTESIRCQGLHIILINQKM